MKVEVANFYETLMYCLGKKVSSDKSTTTESSFFGGMFELYDEEDIEKYSSIKELLDAIRVDIGDILYQFHFENHLRISEVPGQLAEDKEYFLKEDWHTELHYRYGYCHTFDPSVVIDKKVQVTQEDSFGTNLLSMNLEFNV